MQLWFGLSYMKLSHSHFISVRRNFERQGKPSAKPDGIVTYVEGDKSMA